MTIDKNTAAELAQFDADENAQVQDGHGLSPEQLDFAKEVISEERKLVETGEESADDAEDNVAATINDVLFDNPEDDLGDDA